MELGELNERLTSAAQGESVLRQIFSPNATGAMSEGMGGTLVNPSVALNTTAPAQKLKPDVFKH